MIGFPNCALEDSSRQNPNVKSRRSLDVFHHSHSMPSNGWISWIRRNRTQSDTVLGRVSHVSKRFNLIDLRRTQQLETCKDFSRHILMTFAVSYRFVNRYVIFIIIIIIVIISSSSSSSPLPSFSCTSFSWQWRSMRCLWRFVCLFVCACMSAVIRTTPKVVGGLRRDFLDREHRGMERID